MWDTAWEGQNPEDGGLVHKAEILRLSSTRPSQRLVTVFIRRHKESFH